MATTGQNIPRNPTTVDELRRAFQRLKGQLAGITPLVRGATDPARTISYNATNGLEVVYDANGGLTTNAPFTIGSFAGLKVRGLAQRATDTAAGSYTQGDAWANTSTGSNNMVLSGGGNAVGLGGLAWSQATPGGAVVNTTTETIVYTGPTYVANTFTAGKVMKFRIGGIYRAGGTSSVAINAYLGNIAAGNQIWAVNIGTLGTTSATDKPWLADMNFVTYLGGASGGFQRWGTQQFQTTSVTYSPNSVALMNLTLARQLIITVKWTVATTSDTITMCYGYGEIVG